MLQESNVLILPERENESLDNPDNENVDEDAGYPQSPDSDVPESTFSNPNRVRCSFLPTAGRMNLMLNYILIGRTSTGKV